MTDTTLSRRRFITAALTAAGGLALGVGIAGPAEAASLGVRPWGDEAKRYPGEINAWVVIEPDDTVIIRYGRAEMGQGSFTALPQILTEELECDWAFVKPEYASANRNLKENKVYGSLATGGSRAVTSPGQSTSVIRRCSPATPTAELATRSPDGAGVRCWPVSSAVRAKVVGSAFSTPVAIRGRSTDANSRTCSWDSSVV